MTVTADERIVRLPSRIFPNVCPKAHRRTGNISNIFMGMKMTDEQQRGCYILYMSTEQEDQRCQLTFLTHPSVKEKQKKYKVNGKSWVVSK